MTIPPLVPRPAACHALPGAGPWIDASCPLIAGPGAGPEARMLAADLARILGRAPAILDDAAVVQGPSLRLLRTAPAGSGDEGYRLTSDHAGVTIEASAPAGLFYGGQTLLQLLPCSAPAGARLPAIIIEDHPRFPWRGAMVDTARRFLPVEDLLRFIDAMARHRLNRLHLHLTDDQGWRIEILRYPLLTRIGGWRRETQIGHHWLRPRRFDGVPHGGFYTREDIRRIVSYATARHITVVPEIEMPGHAQAAIAAYPWLGNDGPPCEVRTHWGVNPHIFNAEERTMRFLEDVLSEVLELFPSPWIHIGGDEAAKDEWLASPRIQERIRDLGVGDVHGLQAWIIRRMDAFLSARGRRLIGWDEILDGGLSPNATVMSWRGFAGGIAAAKQGHQVIMAPESHTYLDHYQHPDLVSQAQAIGTILSVEQVYAFEPIPPELAEPEQPLVLGGQAQLWSEYILDARHLERMAFPRLCALSEVLWSPRGNRDPADFMHRLDGHLARLDALGIDRFTPPAPGAIPARPRDRDRPVLVLPGDGPDGSATPDLEALARDGARAGFAEAVLAASPEHQAALEGRVGGRIRRHLPLRYVHRPSDGPGGILAGALAGLERPCGVVEPGACRHDGDLMALAQMLARADATCVLVIRPPGCLPDRIGHRCAISTDGYDLLLGMEGISGPDGAMIRTLSPDAPASTGLWGLQPHGYALLVAGLGDADRPIAGIMLDARDRHGWQIRCARIAQRIGSERNPT